MNFLNETKMLFFRKYILAITGLFLCLFLVIHLLGNLTLLLPAEHAHLLYNSYSHALASNPFIKVVSIFLYLAILVHTAYAAITTRINKKLKVQNYQMNHTRLNSSWTSQNMGLLGFTILIFIVVHMGNFWARVKLGLGDSIPLDVNGHKDLYLLTAELFSNLPYVIFYSLLIIPLGLHIHHGFASAFHSLGFSHKRYMNYVSTMAKGYSICIFIGFFLIPIVMFVRGMK